MTIDNAALGKLASEATAGPWEWADSFLFNRETDDGVLEHSGPADYAHEGCRWPVSDADKAFIAAARTAVPDLLDQLDRAEAENVRLQARLDSAEIMLGGGKLNAEHRAAHEWNAHKQTIEERDQLQAQLSACHAALNEACDLLDSALADNPYAISAKSIAALRSVGRAK